MCDHRILIYDVSDDLWFCIEEGCRFKVKGSPKGYHRTLTGTLQKNQ